MVRQAAGAISAALLNDCIHLQTIRLPLSESMYSDSEEGFVADRAIGWQGGPQETCRYLLPLVKQVLQSTDTLSIEGAQKSPSTSSGLVARVREQILLDFDGSALLTSECPLGPRGDAQALLQPNTDDYYSKVMKQVENQLMVPPKDDTSDETSRLFLLVNPAWKSADSFGIFGRRRAQTEILDRYEITYAVDQFVIRGQKCSLLKVWPHDWCVYVANLPYDSQKDGEEATFLGAFSTRPPYEKVDELIQQYVQENAAK